MLNRSKIRLALEKIYKPILKMAIADAKIKIQTLQHPRKTSIFEGKR